MNFRDMVAFDYEAAQQWANQQEQERQRMEDEQTRDMAEMDFPFQDVIGKRVRFWWGSNPRKGRLTEARDGRLRLVDESGRHWIIHQFDAMEILEG